MTPEHLFLTAAMGMRNRYNHGIDDRLLEDMGVTREQLARATRWFRRKPR